MPIPSLIAPVVSYENVSVTDHKLKATLMYREKIVSLYSSGKYSTFLTQVTALLLPP